MNLTSALAAARLALRTIAAARGTHAAPSHHEHGQAPFRRPVTPGHCPPRSVLPAPSHRTAMD